MYTYKKIQSSRTLGDHHYECNENTTQLTQDQINYLMKITSDVSPDVFENIVMCFCNCLEQGVKVEQVSSDFFMALFSKIFTYSGEKNRFINNKSMSKEMMNMILFILNKIVFSDQGWLKFLGTGYINIIITILSFFTNENAKDTIWIEEKILTVILEIAKNKYQILEVPKIDNGTGEKVFDKIALKQFHDLFKHCYTLYDKFAKLIIISNRKEMTPEEKSILELSYENRIVSLEICVYLFTHYSDQCPSNKIHPGVRISSSLTSILSESLNENVYKEFSKKSSEKVIHIIYLLFKGMKYRKNFDFFLTQELIDVQIKNLCCQTSPKNVILCLQTLAISCNAVDICACYIINSESFNKFNPLNFEQNENVILAYCQVWREATYIANKKDMFFSYIHNKATKIIKDNASKIIDMSFELFKKCNFDIIKEIFLVFVSYLNIGDKILIQYILKKFESADLDFVQLFIFHFQSAQTLELVLFIEACNNLILFSEADINYKNIPERLIEEGIENIINYDLNMESYPKKYQNIIYYLQKYFSKLLK